MPKVRLTYSRDIAREGRDVVEVSVERAAILVRLRRAEVIPDPPAKTSRKRATPARRKPRGH